MIRNKLTFHKVKILKINPEQVDRTILGTARWSDACDNDKRRWHADMKWEVKCIEEKELILPPGWRWRYNWNDHIVVDRPNDMSHFATALIDEDTGEFIDPRDLYNISKL